MNKYPALMAYINHRSKLDTTRKWCDKLHEDERAAEDGYFAAVAAELAQAQADYKAEQEAQGKNGYPYNSAMGVFLGLPLRSNNEPPHGYYMAGCVMHHYRFGVARREVEALIAAGKPLSVVLARSKKDRKPVRFAKYQGVEQIKIVGNTIETRSEKRGHRLSGNWSTETVMEAVALAMRTGAAYGEGVPDERIVVG